MANSEHTSKFKGVDAWNRWRKKNPAINVDLRRLNFTRANLSGANFSNADLTESNLHETNLNRVNFSGANLRGANLSGANFRTADFSGANLSGVNLSGMNLSGVNLSGMNLSGVNLSGANLAGVNLRVANLRGANLSAADLRRTDLSEADLREANLRAASLNDAYLIRTDLSGADLSEANLSQVGLYETAFVDANLSGASGMDTCAHIGPSKIDHRAIIKSGNLSLNFLRGCGVPETLITYLPSLLNDAIQFYSCFISYSAKDQNFADRLHADLQNKGVRCWFAPHDIQAGKKIHEQIDDAIRIHDRLLLILSTASIGSEWVQTEIAKARRREIREKRRMLFPVRLVDFETLREWECFDADTGKDSAREIREYFVPDFSNWKNHDAYQQAFAGLLRDLKAQQSASKVGEFQILAVQHPGENTAPAVWSVRAGWGAPTTDIMFLEAVPFCDEAKAFEWKGTVSMTFLPPEIGETIAGFGYPSSTGEILPGEPSQIRFALHPHTTVGVVTQVFEERRDRSLLKFPCFELNARFEGGMSGGPLFNTKGQLCGIICASLQQMDQQASHVSYGATLWPAMGTNIEFQGPGLICKGPYPVFELAKIGVMHAVGWEEVIGRITNEIDDEGREWPRLRSKNVSA